MKRRIAFLLFLLTALSVCGCADAKQIDDTAFVLALGVEQGKDKRYDFTFSLPYLNESTEVGENAKFHAISCQADSLYDAVDLVNANSAYQLDFTHLNFLALDRELAQRGVRDVLEPMMRMPDVRKTALVIVARQGAKAFLEGFETDKETNLSKLQQSIIEQADDTGLFPECTIAQLYSSIEQQRFTAAVALGGVSRSPEQPEDESAPQTSAAPAAAGAAEQGFEEKAGELPMQLTTKSQVFGAALFDGDRLCTTITGEQCRFLLMGSDVFESGYFTIEDAQGQAVTLRIRRRKDRDAKVDVAAVPVKAQLTVYLDATIVSYTGGPYEEEQQAVEAFASLVQDYLSRGLAEAAALDRTYGLDAFGLGRVAVAQFTDEQTWQTFDWAQRRKDMQVQTAVNVRVHPRHNNPGGGR